MIKIFRILDLFVSLVLVALGVAIFFITKNWWAVALVGVAYIIWEIIVFKTYFKVRKVNREIWNFGYNCGAMEADDDEIEDDDWYDEEDEDEEGM